MKNNTSDLLDDVFMNTHLKNFLRKINASLKLKNGLTLMVKPFFMQFGTPSGSQPIYFYIFYQVV